MKGHSLQSSVLLVKHTKEDISCQVSVQSRPVVHVCVHRIFTRACLREGMSMRKGSGRGNSITFGMTLLEMPLGILNAGAIPQHAGPQCGELLAVKYTICTTSTHCVQHSVYSTVCTTQQLLHSVYHNKVQDLYTCTQCNTSEERLVNTRSYLQLVHHRHHHHHNPSHRLMCHFT